MFTGLKREWIIGRALKKLSRQRVVGTMQLGIKHVLGIKLVFLILFLGVINADSGEVPLLVSPHLMSYLDKIVDLTGRRVVVERRSLPFGLKAGFQRDPQFIRIILDPSLDLKSDYAEQSIAHELTHGLLAYGKGYSDLTPKRPLTAKEQKHRNTTAMVVEEIVVNKIIQNDGFSPFSPDYPANVQQETKVAYTRQMYHSDFIDDEEGLNQWMVLRYTNAWGLVEYCSLDQNVKDIISEYLRAFKNGYPKQFGMAEQIKTAVKQNNIFEADGYRKTMVSILGLWRLNNFLQILDS